MRWVVALLGIAVLVAAGAALHAPERVHLAPSPGASHFRTFGGIQPGVVASLSSTEGGRFPYDLPLWHNTSSTNTSLAHVYPVNMTLSPPNAPLTAVLTVNAGAYVPVVLAKQGTVTLLNATVQGQATVSPTASSTGLSVRILQLFTSSGGAVPLGTYGIWVNVTETATLANTTSIIWAQHVTTFNATYSFASPYGYWLNASTVFVPFPSGLSVNFTSVKVANATSVQTAYAGVYLTNGTLGPKKGLTFTLSFVPVPTTTGPAVILTLTSPRLVHGSSTLYTAFGNWTNSGPLPYAGIYVLGVPSTFAFAVDPASVHVRVGSVVFLNAPGTYYYAFKGSNLSSSSFTTQGQNVVLVPGTLTVPVGTTESFQANFSSMFAPPSESLFANHVLLAFGSVSVTFGTLVEGLMVLPVLYAGVVLRVHRGDSSERLRVVVVHLVAAQVALLSLLALGVVF